MYTTTMKQVKQNKTDKANDLDIQVSDIFVATSAKKRAFIEQFNYSSVNFTQKDLGTILGFFIVRDSNPSSENIVNFLASEIKKKYFTPNNKKDIEEKFELTLHHTNRILEEIANIGNVEWLGHIDGAVCVISNNNIHFSVTGNAHVLLLRKNMLINISEGLASPEASEHPLKTFVDISSGTLQADDKIIITSQELLDLVPFEELQKNAIRFNRDNFIQFINTALTNECSLATATIIDVKKPKTKKLETPEVMPTKVETSKNAFSAKTYESIEQTNDKEIKPETELDNIIKEQIHKEEYVDPRTGHIHMQATEDNSPEGSATFVLVKEKLSDIQEITSEFFKKQKYNLSKKISELKSSTTKFKKISPENTQGSVDNIPIPIKAKISKNLRKISLGTKTLVKTLIYKSKLLLSSISTKYSRSSVKFTEKKETIIPQKEETLNEKHTILPNFHHLNQTWHKMHTQTKIIAVALLLFIIVTPLLFAKLSKRQPNTQKNNVNKTSSSQVTQQQTEPSTDKKTTPQKQTGAQITSNTLLDGSNLLATLVLNDKEFVIGQNNITPLNNSSKEISRIPNDEEIRLATSMGDLDLIFLLTNSGNLYSFSPTTKKFTKQNNIPDFDSSKVSAINTFMTYLYTLDDNGITRYARIENGFGNEKKWLKENIDLKNATSFAIDENIYVTKEGQVIKFTRGKKQDFNLESNNAYIDFAYTTEDTKFLWLLDTKNNEVLKIDKSNNKTLAKYEIEELKDIISFTVNEKKKVAIITTQNKVLSLQLDN